MKADPILLSQAEWVYDALRRKKFVRIEGTAYDYTIRAGYVDLVKPDGEIYTVSPVSCTCADNLYRRRPGGCKHRMAVKALGMLKRAAALKKQQPQEQGAAS